MGNFHISIEGVGIHHNRNTPTDVNRMAQSFVAHLKAEGHNVTKATITAGGADDLMAVDYSIYDDEKEGTGENQNRG